MNQNEVIGLIGVVTIVIVFSVIVGVLCYGFGAQATCHYGYDGYSSYSAWRNNINSSEIEEARRSMDYSTYGFDRPPTTGGGI